MRKWRLIGTGSVMTVAVLVLSASPASAFSIFGINFGDSQPAQSSQLPPAATVQQTADNASGQAANFIDDVVTNANTNTCLQFTDHEYEVCTAYIFNSAIADLVPYYKYANSSNSSLMRLVSYRLDSRYTGQANQLIRSRVSWWPTNIDNDVDVPSIRILSVNADLANNSATLQTVETWRVTNSADNVIYQETNTPHTVTMARVPSYVLHKWVVTDIE